MGSGHRKARSTHTPSTLHGYNTDDSDLEVLPSPHELELQRAPVFCEILKSEPKTCSASANDSAKASLNGGWSSVSKSSQQQSTSVTVL